MMKKLLVLLLVLGMASVANAGFFPMTLTLSGPGTVATNTLFTVNGVMTGLTTPDTDIQAITNFKIDISGVANTPGPESNITSHVRFDAPCTRTYAMMDLNSDAPAPYVLNGSILFSFEVTSGTEVGNINYTVDDVSFSSSILMYAVSGASNYSYKSLGSGYGPLTVVGGSTFVPEPMTIALLGLGGLLLRRRK